MFVDTHVHFNIMVDKKSDEMLDSKHFPIIEALIREAEKGGISKFINVGTSVAESQNSIEIATRYKSVFAAVGIHPCDVKTTWSEDIKEIEKMLENKGKNKIVAVGEIGLDYYHQPYNKKLQHDAFKAQIECALKHDLPIIMHVREAADDALRVLEEYVPELRGVNHCFSHPLYVAEKLIEWGFYLGIDAPITYPKNQWFRDVVKQLPLTSLVLETDAPFLPPQIYRGKKNKSEYIPLFAEVIAGLHNVSLEKLSAITSANAQMLFRII